MGAEKFIGYFICSGVTFAVVVATLFCIYMYIVETKRLKIKEKIAKYWAISNYIKMYLEVKKLNDFVSEDVVEKANQAMKVLEKELGF